MKNVVIADSLYTDTIHAYDPDGDLLTYQVVAGPDQISIKDSILSWIPLAQDTGMKTIIIAVVDTFRYLPTSIAWTVQVNFSSTLHRSREVQLLFEEAKGEVVGLRGKPFLRSVTPAILTRSQYISNKNLFSDNDYTQTQKDQINKILLTEGFLRSGDDYFEQSTSMYQTMVDGFYRNNTDTVWVIVDDTLKNIDGSFKETLFHELMHALQDQYYNLSRIQATARSSDQHYAQLYTIEGEATYFGIFYLYKMLYGNYPPNSSPVRNAFTSIAVSVNKDLDSLHNIGKRLYIYQPVQWAYYSYGPLFIDSVAGGANGSIVDSKIFASLPVKTSEVMHPVNFVTPNRSNYNLNLTPFLNVATLTHSIYDADALGEMLLCVLFREWNNPYYLANSSGLISDQIFVLGNAAGDSLSLAWYLTWNTASQAQAFVANYRSILCAKYGLVLPSITFNSTNAILDHPQNLNLYVEQIGTDVIVLEKYPTDKKALWINALKQTTKSAWPVAKVSTHGTERLPRIPKYRDTDFYPNPNSGYYCRIR
jgi:hypothetical protein